MATTTQTINLTFTSLDHGLIANPNTSMDVAFRSSSSINRLLGVYLTHVQGSEYQVHLDFTRDLSGYFENNGSIRIVVGSIGVNLPIPFPDQREPYVWSGSSLLSTSLENFIAATSDGDSDVSGTIRFSQTDPTEDHAVDAGTAAFALTVIEPTVTRTEPDDHTEDSGTVAVAFDVPDQPEAYQSINLSANLWNSYSFGIIWQDQANSISINSALSGNSNTTFSALFLLNNGTIQLHFNREGAIDDLSDAFESNGGIRLTIGSGSWAFPLAGADTDEPYDWSPANSADLSAARTAAQSATAVTLEISDNAAADFSISADHTEDSGSAAVAFDVPQPSAAHGTPTDHAEDSGTVAVAFNVPQPSRTHGTPTDHAKDSGTVAVAFDVPEPSRTHGTPTDHAEDSGTVAVAFDVPEPTAAHVTPPLLPSVFDDTGLDVFAFAVVTSGVPESNGTIYRSTENGGPLGSVNAGADLALSQTQSITRIALNAGGIDGNLRIWDNPSADRFDQFFDTDNTDLTARLQFPNAGPFELTKGAQGGHFSNWLTSNQEAINAMTAARATGQQFIIAVAQAVATVDHAVAPGVVTLAFNVPQPGSTHGEPVDHAVDSGSVNIAFAVPQPTAAHGTPTDHAEDSANGRLPSPSMFLSRHVHTERQRTTPRSGTVAVAFDVPEPTAAHVTPPLLPSVFDDTGLDVFAFAVVTSGVPESNARSTEALKTADLSGL